MGDLCFGKPFGVKEEGSDLRHIIHLLGSMMMMMYPVSSTRQLFSAAELVEDEARPASQGTYRHSHRSHNPRLYRSGYGSSPGV